MANQRLNQLVGPSRFGVPTRSSHPRSRVAHECERRSRDSPVGPCIAHRCLSHWLPGVPSRPSARNATAERTSPIADLDRQLSPAMLPKLVQPFGPLQAVLLSSARYPWCDEEHKPKFQLARKSSVSARHLSPLPPGARPPEAARRSPRPAPRPRPQSEWLGSFGHATARQER